MAPTASDWFYGRRSKCCRRLDTRRWSISVVADSPVEPAPEKVCALGCESSLLEWPGQPPTVGSVARWWPKKWSIESGDGGEPLSGYEYAWWQWRKRRRIADARGLERFDWRTIRIALRRPADHRRHDPPES